jgi:glycosyltransferase involved in cell wall biosynthesis
MASQKVEDADMIKGLYFRIFYLVTLVWYQLSAYAIPKVSVIVPVYNAEQFLEICLDSILSQSQKDIEIICVDDASKDTSKGILKKYAKKDQRLKIICHKKNMGVSATRNHGLNIATGEYIGFVDSDDYIHPDMFKIMYDEVKKGDFDVVFCNFTILDKLDKDYPHKTLTYKKRTYNGNLGFTNYCFFHNVCWNKLYKKSLVDSVRFNEDLITSEDFYFNLCMNKFVKKYVFLSAPLYCYRKHDASITMSTFSQKKAYSFCKVVELLNTSPDVVLTPKQKYHFSLFIAADAMLRSTFYGTWEAFTYTLGRIKNMRNAGFINIGDLLKVSWSALMETLWPSSIRND